MRALIRPLVALLLILVPALAQAQAQGGSDEMVRAWQLSGGQERILSFVSAVTIEPDGDLDVTETIRLVSLNQEINHGIQRDFPTSYINGAGQHTRVGFSVVSVQRDGHDEPWDRISLSNGVRIRIGSAEVTLPPGEHVFVIRYHTTRQMIYGDTSDELYWNVTGNGWTFPIDVAEAHITLPTAAAFGNRAVYTGPQGATAHDAAVVDEKPGTIVFRTTKPLDREQGLTVAVAFPKGVLTAPSPGRRASWWLEDWGALIAGLAACLGLAVYYIRAWWKAGKGPRAGTVVPIFSPPDDLTPAAARYIANMKFDDRGFSAAIVDLGVRRLLHITQEEGGWLSKGRTMLTRTEDGRGVDLPAPEKAMDAKLFGRGGMIELKQENHSTLQAARTALEEGLDAAYLEAMFRKNRDWAVWGLLAIPLSMLAISVFALSVSSATSTAERIGFPLIALILLAGAWWGRGMAMKAKGCLAAVAWVAVVGVGLVAGTFALGTMISALAVGAVEIALPLLLLPVAISAFWWMYAPTTAGRLMMDRINGFKQYLSIAEEQRLETMHPPEKTPELFERYLPYAIALEVENRWAEKFAGVLATAAAAGAAAGTASWYTGNGHVWDDPQGFANDIGSSLASTVSSSSTSPSSSGGGSSGGGSSGGGGGGGGGSGW
jgi:uncharacterized membrane protein YgcG